MNVRIEEKETMRNVVLFKKEIEEFGILELRLFNIELDLPIIYEWVNLEYAVYWGMNHLSYDEVKKIYENLIKNTSVYIGLFNGEISFLLECYNPFKDNIKDYYTVREGDIGMHILVGPPKTRITGFTWNIFKFIMSFIFTDTKIQRVVVEPDIRNVKIHELNRKAGFEFQKIIVFPHKKAHLEFCTKENFIKAISNEK